MVALTMEDATESMGGLHLPSLPPLGTLITLDGGYSHVQVIAIVINGHLLNEYNTAAMIEKQEAEHRIFKTKSNTAIAIVRAWQPPQGGDES